VGSSLLNERAETRTTLAIVQEAVQTFERCFEPSQRISQPLEPQPAAYTGTAPTGTTAAGGMAAGGAATLPPKPTAFAPPAAGAVAAGAAAASLPDEPSASALPDAAGARAERCRERLRGLLDHFELLSSEQVRSPLIAFNCP
jgi:hypothetical protein